MEDHTPVTKLVLTLDVSELRKLLEEINTAKSCCKCCQVAQAETSSTIKSTGVIHTRGMKCNLVEVSNDCCVKGAISASDSQPQMEFTDDSMIIKSADGKRSIKIPLDL